LAMTRLLEASKTLAGDTVLAEVQIDFETRVPVTFRDKTININLLQLAVYYGNEAAMELLVNQVGMNVNAECDGVTAILLAVDISHYFIIIPNLNSKDNLLREDGENQFTTRRKNQTRFIRFLLNSGANINYSSPNFEYGSALEIAVKDCDCSLVRFLLLYGARTGLSATSSTTFSEPNPQARDDMGTIVPLVKLIPSSDKLDKELEKMILAAAAFHQAYTASNPAKIFIHLNSAFYQDIELTLDYLVLVATDCAENTRGDARNSPLYYNPSFYKASLSNIIALGENHFFDQMTQEQILIFFSLLVKNMKLFSNTNIFGSKEVYLTLLIKLESILLESIKVRISETKPETSDYFLLTKMMKTIEELLATKPQVEQQLSAASLSTPAAAPAAARNKPVAKPTAPAAVVPVPAAVARKSSNIPARVLPDVSGRLHETAAQTSAIFSTQRTGTTPPAFFFVKPGASSPKPAAAEDPGKEKRSISTEPKLEVSVKVSIYKPRVSEESVAKRCCYVAFRVNEENFSLITRKSKVGMILDMAVNPISTACSLGDDLVLNSLEFCSSEEKAKKLLLAQVSFAEFKNTVPVILVIEGYSAQCFKDLYDGRIKGYSKSPHKFLPVGLLEFLQKKKAESFKQALEVKEDSGQINEERKYVQKRLTDIDFVAPLVSADEIEHVLSSHDSSNLEVDVKPMRDILGAARPL
jgi:hypothetical protein